MKLQLVGLCCWWSTRPIGQSVSLLVLLVIWYLKHFFPQLWCWSILFHYSLYYFPHYLFNSNQVWTWEVWGSWGRDAISRWCYSNLFGWQNYAETEGLMTQVIQWIWIPAIRVTVGHLHSFEKLNGSQPRKPVHNYSGCRYKGGPFVYIGRCKMEKQIPWPHNWAAIWMSFPS